MHRYKITLIVETGFELSPDRMLKNVVALDEWLKLIGALQSKRALRLISIAAGREEDR